MATTKITDLTAYTDPVNTDVLPIVDVTSDVTKKVSIANVMKNASLGSNTTPGIAFDGDPNTGIYSPGADQVAVTTGGTQRLLIDSAGAVTIAGDLTVNGTTTNINTTNLVIEDKNIILGDVTTPTDVTADGGGITLKGTTDKTINWVDSTDAWTSSERFSYPLGSAAAPTLTFTGDANTGIYSPGADQVAISTNGSERVKINSTGEILVGASLTSIDSNFVVQANAAASGLRGVGINNNGGYGVYLTYDNTARYSGGACLRNVANSLLAFETNNTERFRVRADGTFEIKGGGTAGVTPAVSVNPSASANSLVIDSSGRVGLGTSSISEKLHVQDGNILVRQANFADPSITISQGTGTTGNTSILNFADSSGTTAFIQGRGSAFGSGINKALQLGTNGTVALTIDSSQRVGIGTTSPDANSQLHVVGSSYQPLYINTTGAGGGGAAFLRSGTQALYVGTAGGSWLTGSSTADGLIRSEANLIFGIGNSEKTRIDSSGRFLVGTSTSVGDEKFVTQGYVGVAAGEGQIALRRGSNVSAGSQALGLIRFSDLNANHGASIGAVSNSGWTTGSSHPCNLVFSTTADGASSPTERARITQQGVLKVSNAGTYANSTGPYHEFVSTYSNEYAFRVWHNGNASQQYGIYVRTTTDQNDSTRTFLECVGNTTDRAVIRSNGGLANYSANNVNLSDRNVKKDIEPAAGTWDCLKEWEIVNFRYKDQPDNADLNMGVIAQQVAESCPEVITVFQEAKEATEDQPAQEERIGVKEQQMMWMAIKALQEAQLRIETLEAEVAALKGA